MECLHLKHLTDWTLFKQSSTLSMKIVLLHDGNRLSSIPFGHPVHMRKSYANMSRPRFNKICWPQLENLMRSGSSSSTPTCEAGFDEKHCNQEKQTFQYLKRKFPRLSDAKIKESNSRIRKGSCVCSNFEAERKRSLESVYGSYLWIFLTREEMITTFSWWQFLSKIFCNGTKISGLLRWSNAWGLLLVSVWRCFRTRLQKARNKTMDSWNHYMTFFRPNYLPGILSSIKNSYNITVIRKIKMNFHFVGICK